MPRLKQDCELLLCWIGPKLLCLVLSLTLLMLLLTGCATPPPPVVITEVKVEKQYPPDVWLGDCTEYLPDLPAIINNGNLAEVIAYLVSALLQCNEDKKRLREWKTD